MLNTFLQGDQEGLFELAIQLRTFFYSVICNTATVGLFDRYLTSTKWKLLELYYLKIKFSITNINSP
jgi:hypothetical protein